MKKILLSIAAFMLLGSLSAQNVARECVLFEVFTGVNCPYCPAAANAINQMMEEGLAVAPVAIHTSAFSTPEFYTTETNARANFYGISSYPTAKVDGTLTMSGGGSASQTNYSQYKNMYNNRINVTSPFTIDLSYNYLEGSICQVNVVVNKVGDCSAANLKVMIALTESHIQKNWQGMSELNAVTRDLIPTQNGTAFSGESMTVTETFDMAGFPKENMNLVAWVQSFSTKEVFQAVRISLEPENVNYDVALRKIGSVITKNCSGKTDPSLTIKTFGTETVTSMEIEVKDENSNVINTYNWTGNLPQGETAEVIMPEFDIQGANTLNFNVKKINNHDDAYPFDNYLSIGIESAESHPGDLYFQVKSASDPDRFYMQLKNMETNEITGEWHFDQGGHAYKFYVSIPSNGCYQISAISPNGDGCGNGLGVIKDANNDIFMQFGSNMNVFTNKYAVEFTCENAGVEENSSSYLTVFPNPASNQINIEGEDICEVMIYNALGQIVYSKSGNVESVDTSAFEEGLYVVNVKNINGITTSQRIVIKK
ncbi:MAG: T9SS type A sorting domain-containing protein [Bacteroidales bacterium]|nr:T9SS type A sorting domain-containing protein [Bacteroidales bacterium]